MDKIRQLVMLTVAAVLVVVVGGWFLLVSPQRSTVSDLHAQAATQQQSNGQLTTEIARLKAEARDLPAEQARLAAIAEKLPPNPAMPALVQDLSKAAKRAGIDLQIIEPDTPAPFGSGDSIQLQQPAAPGTATGTTPGSTTSGSATSGSTTSGSTTSGSTTSGSTTSGSTSGSTTTSGGATTLPPGTTTLTPGATPAGGLYQIPISVTAVGSYYELAQFLHQVENLQRAYLVTELNVQPGNPLAATTSVSAPDGSPGAAGGYDGQLTAEVNGFVFEVLTAPPAGSTTLPSTTTG